MGFFCHIEICGNPDIEFLQLPIALYVLPNQQLAELLPTVVWCRNCNRFEVGESNVSPDNILKRIADAETDNLQGFERLYVDSSKKHRREWLHFWREQLRWREIRVSPPKCLRCGSELIRHVDINKTIAFPHPSTGSRTSIRLEHAEKSIDRRLFLYSVEGELLGEIPRFDPCSDQQFNAATPFTVIAKMLETSW